MRTFAKVLGYGLILLFLVAALGFAYKYTNGFNEELKTFYVEYDGRQILTTESKLTLKKDAVHRFNVKYTFDKDDAEPKGYKVKIVPNMSRDFDFTVDGEKHIFSKVGELTAVFGAVKNETYFELYIPESLSFKEVLRKAYNGSTVSVPSDAEANNPYPFKLQISSYNGSITYNIDFTFNADGTTGTGTPDGGNNDTPTTPTEPTIPINPDTPDIPSEPTKESHAITYRIVGNEANLIQADVLCDTTAVEGETVDFAVSLIGDYKSEVTDITVYSGGKIWTTIAAGENDGASNFYKEYSFTMPDADVEIAVTIKAIEVSNYHTLSYDTTGSGDRYSVNVKMAEVAQKGEYVTVSIYLAMDKQDELQISSVVLKNAATGEVIQTLEQFNEFFDFTMPDCDVVIVITLATKDSQPETPTTPTTPTGETYSIIYSASYSNDYDGATDFNDYVTVSCPSTAVASEKVTVTIRLIEDYAELYEIDDVMISYPGMEFSYGFAVSKGNGVYEFTMPDFDMQLYIYVTDKTYS